MADRPTDESFLRAGELAKACGISTDTLRHYERKGVLPAPVRAPNGYRQYPAGALGRVRLIRRALALGFTLDELAGILKVRDRGGAPCRQVRELAEARLSEIEEQLRDLMGLRDDLRAILRDWDDRLSGREPGERTGLLESLGERESAPAPRSLNGRAARKLKIKEKESEA
ncbi:MAG TPA: heavy metal-responsive transcriptional regulator [Blastocatellia bacterium]|nr:heavy metal-responsive transcriptional regulator [Blastocatellia bacterium]